MEAVSTATSLLGTGAIIPYDAASSNSVDARAKQTFARTQDYAGHKTWGYLGGRVYAAHEMDKSIFIGSIVTAVPDGNGYLTGTKNTYVGGFEDGKRHGRGIVKNNDGYFDVIYDQGECVSIVASRPATKSTYEGGFKDGKRHGSGIVKYRNGYFNVIYNKGKCVSIERIASPNTKFKMMRDYEGQKTWRYLDGRVCVAQEMDESSGSAPMGAITFINGATYIGPIVNGVPHGKGYLTSRVFTYEGGFQDGKQHGRGVVKFNNRSFDVIYDEGECVSRVRMAPPRKFELFNIKEK